MAGGKETPRQKMIGMMYLVLTALLALQVSNAVLEKFIFINLSFEATNDEKVVENKGKIESITNTVAESGNREHDLLVVDKAKKIREETAKVLEEIEGYKDELIEVTGGVDESGAFVGQKDIDAASNIMITKGKGDELRDRLNGYADFVREVTHDSTIVKIAKDASEIPVFASDPNQRQKGFAELNFGASTPMVGALASLSQMQNDVIAVETKALEDLAREVGAEDLKFDVIVPMVLPESKVVAPGVKYQADLFIAASSSAVTPTMFIDGEEIEVGADGKGKVEFTATPGAYNSEGIATKTFISAIEVSLPGGRDTVFTDTMEYFVVKPVIQIQSQSVGALYLNCGNELDVQVPQLGTAYNPSFSTNGGVSITGSQRGQVTIIPKSAKVTLAVSSNGNLIGNQEFKVQRIPAPEVKAKLRGRDIDGKTGMPSNTPRIQLVAEPDESFAQFLPKDARFQVAEAEVTLVRGGRGGASQRVSGNVDLRQISSQARAGDNLVIEIKKVRRANFRDEVEDFNNFGPRYITIPLK